MFYRFMYYFFAPWIIKPYFKLFNRLRASGFDNIPASGPVVVIANHMSMWDPVLMFCLIRRRIYFMAKEEIFNVPVIGSILRHCFVFPVKRDSVDRTAMRKAAEILEEGHVLVIFPEGHRSKDGQLLPFKEGAALFAHRAGAPVIPILFENTSKAFPLSIWRRIEIVCGKPIEMGEFQGKKANSNLLVEMTDKFKSCIQKMRDNLAV